MRAGHRALLGVTCAVVLAALACSQYWIYRGRLATVERDRLYRSAALDHDRLLDVCRRRRITTVIDLRLASPDTSAEAAVLARAGIDYVNLPTGQVPSRDTVERFLQLMDGRRHEAVLLHCTHGVGRSGVFAALYRIEYQGWSRWSALAEARALAGLGSFGPSDGKTAFLRSYSPRAARPER